MKTHISFIILIVYLVPLQAQIWDWGRQGEDNEAPSWASYTGTFSAVDPLGNIVIVGNPKDTLRFGNTQLLPEEGFMVKYAPDGDVIWAKPFVTNGCDWNSNGGGITIDDNGDIYIAFNCDTIPNANHFFIKRFDAQGNELKSFSSYGAVSGTVYDIALDASGNIFVCGSVSKFGSGDSLYLGGKGVDRGLLQRPFLFKLDPNGNCIWARSDATTFWQSAFGFTSGDRVAIDKQGNAYLLGVTNATITFGPGLDITIPSWSNGQVYIVKYDVNGGVEWMKYSDPVHSTFDDYDVDGLEISPDGEIYMMGRYPNAITWEGQSVFSNAFNGNFIIKLDDQGDLLWINRMLIEGTATSYGGGDLALDTLNDRVFVMGVGGGASIDTFTVLCNGSTSDIRTHIGAFDENGTPLWLYNVPCSPVYEGEIFGDEISYVDGGFLYISGTLEDGIFALDTLVSPNGFSPFIARLLEKEASLVGRVFRDFNGNGILDSNDYGLPNQIVRSFPLNYVSNTNSAGVFQFGVNLTTHEVVLPFLPQHHTLLSPVDSTYTVNPNASGQLIGGLDYPLVPIPGIHDLEVSLTPLTPVRPGFAVSYRLRAVNVGSTSQNAVLTFLHPDILTYQSSSIMPTTYNDTTSTLTWGLGSFAPYDTVEVMVSFTVPVSAILGGNLTAEATIDPTNGDIEPLDNQDIIMQTVTGSYDPNDKQVLSSQSLSPQMVLDQVPIDYLIRFQNTGTDTAFTVIITDSMSQQLDWSTFQMVDASHSYRLQISEEGLFSWRFDNILLPDSNTNEAESHGFVRFRVSPQADLIVGDTIRNKAAIYFDYNAPIITNTSKTPVSFNSSNEALSLSNFQFRLMPNPSHGVVQVSISAPGYAEGEISVIDILGKTVLRESVRLQNGQFKQHFNWRSLPNGYYLVQMDFGGERVIQKWIKQ